MAVFPESLRNRGRPRLELLDQEMVDVLSAKSGAERLAIAAGMFRSARRMISCHLREQHRDWDDRSLQEEVARRLSHGSG